MEQPINLILLGDPTAGKATQAKALVKRYSLQEFDMGAWLRTLKGAAKKTFKIQETTDKGILTPTELARMKFKEVIFTTPKTKGVFFNGSPKMRGEARLLHGWFRKAGRTDPFVIYLSIPKNEIVSRIKIRMDVEGRSDDDMMHFKNRMKYYAKNIPATVAFLKQHYQFKKVSGLGTRAEVAKRLVAAMEEMKKKARKAHAR